MLFCCPSCKDSLIYSACNYRCQTCDSDYPIVNGIPDFFIEDSQHDFDSDPNVVWLEPDIVEARDVYYELSTRELRGMIYCMKEIGHRTHKSCKVLEVCMGTGHFTRWLSEVCATGTEIYAYDFSWPIIEKAIARVEGLSQVTLFRANTRTVLPFSKGSFDIVYNRLSPLGPRTTSNIQYAFDLLRPGGWYFQAGWKAERFDTSPTDWAIQNGYENAEHHEWRYARIASQQEVVARGVEFNGRSHLRKEKRAAIPIIELEGDRGIGVRGEKRFLINTEENLLIAQKPLQKDIG